MRVPLRASPYLPAAEMISVRKESMRLTMGASAWVLPRPLLFAASRRTAPSRGHAPNNANFTELRSSCGARWESCFVLWGLSTCLIPCPRPSSFRIRRRACTPRGAMRVSWGWPWRQAATRYSPWRPHTAQDGQGKGVYQLVLTLWHDTDEWSE